jgi:dolichol-phosphate mannosyltransferase
MKAFRLSVVVPVFNEEKQVEITLQALRKILTAAQIAYDVIMVDDGSRDATWDRLVALRAEYTELRAIRLSRNFGKEAALCAGLDASEGDACVVMDADLQHPPELIPEMVRLWLDGFPIVEAVKRKRGKESLINKWGAKIFYDVLERLANLHLHDASDFKLLDGRIVGIWKGLQERETFFRGLTAWVGFPRTKVYFEVPARYHGQSRWSKMKLVKLAINAITSFSALPLQLVTSLGVLFLAGAIPMTIQTLYNKFSGHAYSGFTTVITLELAIGSILMISLGIIGTYLARIFDEVKRRPRYLVSESTQIEKIGDH